MRTSLQTRTVLVSMALLVFAGPAMAQVDNKVTFEAPFEFYAGNTQMPAGSYTVSQPDINAKVLLIESPTGGHSAFVDYLPVEADAPPSKSQITFNKYGTTDFLNLITLQGQKSEMQIVESQAEQDAAKADAAATHSLSVKTGR
jgi:hypothetical protein